MTATGQTLEEQVWCAVPVRNNAATVARVVRGCLKHCEHTVVVDDGSMDADLVDLLAKYPVTVIRHPVNMGKGEALRTALNHVHGHGGTHMIAVDADGQHDPDDLPLFLQAIRESPGSLLIGVREFDPENVPGRSRFGRAFSDFWVHLETGVHPGDSQSGFRAYPVSAVLALPVQASRYGYEIEILVRAVWAGVPLGQVPVHVDYDPPESYTSSFRPFVDNARISAVHTRLVCRRIFGRRATTRGSIPSTQSEERSASRA